jgi:hypothetical protein
MAVVKNKDTEENRQFWSHVEAVAKEVNTWPSWTEAQKRPEHPQEETSSNKSQACDKDR